MIALGMAYAVVVSVLITVTAWLLEQGARLRQRPTRVIWAVAMSVMLVVGLSAAGPAMGRSQRAATETALPDRRLAGTSVRRAAGTSPSLGDYSRRTRDAISARVAAEGVRLAAWNRLLLSVWALLTAFLGGAVAHAALEGRRLQHGLEEREVDGTNVRLTDAVGPSAVGTLAPGILLPRWALALDESLLSLVLQHEREHLKARDPLLLLLALGAVVLVPWNLPLWWAWRRLRLAMEVDCDARVLRAHPDVRRYAQLLLLTGQRAVRTPWASRPVITVAAPLQPHASQLALRIHTMTQPRTARTMRRSALLVGAAAATATVAFALPTPRASAASPAAPLHASRAVVHLTSVGLDGMELTGDSLVSPLLVYATGTARVGIAGQKLVALNDTLRLYRLPAITADVTDGDVHLELTGPGSIQVGGDVTGGPATHVTAKGHHIVLLKGGIGIRPMR